MAHHIELIHLLVAAPWLAGVPGWLAWQAFGVSASDSLEGVERVFIYAFASLVISTGLATILAELGILSLISLLASVLLVCLALWIRERGRGKGKKGKREKGKKGRGENGKGKGERGIHSPSSILHSPFSIFHSPFSLWSVGLLAILILAAVLFFRPAEAVLVMDDAGVYVIHGLTLARTGRLDILDPVLPSLSRAGADQWLPFVRYESSYIRHAGAFYIWNWGRGLIRPSFFHLPSIWMAVLALIVGPGAALWATPLAGLLAVVGFALLGRRLFGPAVGLGGAMLLTVSFPQVWYARYPTSEIFMQAWFLGGLFLLTVFIQQRLRLAAIAAGVALGQLFLIRIDAWVAVAAIGLCFAVWRLKDHPASLASGEAGDRWFLLPLGLTFAWAGLHAAVFATPYVVSLAHLYLTARVGAIAMVIILIGISVAFLAWCRPDALRTVVAFGRETLHLRRARVPAAIWMLGLLVLGAGVWISGGGTQPDWKAVEWLSWYFTPPGLVAALVGSVCVIRRGGPRKGGTAKGVSRPAQVLLLVALLYALLYLPDPRANPIQPWGVRRFVPAVIPALVLMIAYFAVRFPVPVSEKPRLFVRVGLVLIMAFLLAQTMWPVLVHEEYAGAWDQVEMLAGKFEPGAVVLFNQTGVGQAVAQPLTYLYNRSAFVLQAEAPDVQMMQRLVEQWISQGRPVYLALTGLAPWLADFDMQVVPAGDLTFRFPRLERTVAGVPRDIYTLKWPVDLYQLVPVGASPPVHRLGMGPGELTYLREGFHGRETTSGGVSFRWTDGAAHISLPVSRSASSVRLRVSGPPAGIPRPVLRLSVDGDAVGAWELADEFITLRADVPAGAADDGRLDVELRSDTWVPSQVGRGDDDRRLGVIVDWVAVSNDEW